MKHIFSLLRILYGLYLLFMTAAYFGFLPEPDAGMFTTEGWQFLQALMASGYIMPTLGVLTGVAGICFVMKKWLPFAAVLLMPLSVNVTLFHIFLDANPIGPAAAPAYIFTAINVWLLWQYKERYSVMFV